MAGLVAALVLLVGACNGGMRPSLVVPPTPEPEPALQLELPAAPETVAPLAPAPDELPLESSVDDAILAWALDRDIPYIDSCAAIEPTPGLLCDSPTSRDTVRLLGPNPDQAWYVVTVEAIPHDSGQGYRVVSVDIAGR